MIALILAGCATLGPCADGGESAEATCSAELGDEVETRIVFIGHGVLGYTSDTATMDTDPFLRVLPTQAEFEAFWATNEDVLGTDKPLIEFTDHQAVVANGNGIACQTNTRLRGIFRAAQGAGLVAWVYTDVACAHCDTAGPPRIEVWEVPRGAIEVCAETEDGC